MTETTETVTQQELPLDASPADGTTFRPYIEIADRPGAFDFDDRYFSEEGAASELFGTYDAMVREFDRDPAARFQLVRRSDSDFTGYLYVEGIGARVVRGGVQWVAPEPVAA